MTTTDIDMGGKAIFKQLKNLADAQVFVGVFSDEEPYDKDGRSVGVAQVAFWNEYGTENIPERSFIRSAFDENRVSLKKIMDDSLGELLDGRATHTKALNKAGAALRKMIKAKIIAFRSPANAPSTIAKKGFDNPLIDTKKLLNSIEYKKMKGRY